MAPSVNHVRPTVINAMMEAPARVVNAKTDLSWIQIMLDNAGARNLFISKITIVCRNVLETFTNIGIQENAKNAPPLVKNATTLILVLSV